MVPGINHDVRIDVAVVADDNTLTDVASGGDEAALADDRVGFDDRVGIDAGGGRDLRARIDDGRRMNRSRILLLGIQQLCGGGERKSRVGIEQQRLGGGDLGVRLPHNDRAGARFHRQFKMARRLDEDEVAGLSVGDAGDFGDFDACRRR